MFFSRRSEKTALERGMWALLLAQFFSAFADNALLFITVALLQSLAYPDWSKPVLQILFVTAYIVTAPLVGHWADSFAKSRVMLLATGLKVLGTLLITLSNSAAFFGYLLVGFGAAAYSPAKYGILSELVAQKKLVKANGLIESSTIIAILSGAIVGGLLADWDLNRALWICCSTYLLSVGANLFIPLTAATHSIERWQANQFLCRFWQHNKALWQNIDARFSLLGTSLFWGAGTVLRFLLILWVPQVLGVTSNSLPAALNGLVAVGIAIGAGISAKWMTWERIHYCWYAGGILGCVITVFSLQDNYFASYGLLLLIGMLGGVFVVPLNALLQRQGQCTIGVGRAIAVQNLWENLAMLLLLSGYSLGVKAGGDAVLIGSGFGLLFVLLIVVLGYKHQQILARNSCHRGAASE